MRQTHSLVVAYILWLFGFMGLHRFYYNSKKMGALYFCTGGLLGVGWLVDLFFLPRIHRKFMNKPPEDGPANYTLAWMLLLGLGVFGFHKLYLHKMSMFFLYFFTFGIFGLGIVYDFVTLNDQVEIFNIKAKK